MRQIKALIPADEWYLQHDEVLLPVAAFGVIDEDGTESVQPLIAQDDRLVQISALPAHYGANLVHVDRTGPKAKKGRKGRDRGD